MIRERTMRSSFVFLAAGLIWALTGCSGSRPAASEKPEVISNVAVIVAQETTVPDWLEAVGTVQAARKSAVSSQIMGNLVAIHAHEGDRVQAGQILALIDDTQPRAAAAQAAAALAAAKNEVTLAESDLALAKSTLARYQQLFENKSVSPQEFDEVKTRYASASARGDVARAEQDRATAALQQAETSLSYTQVRAPFTGLITEKLAAVGTLATPGMPIFTMEDTRRYRLDARRSMKTISGSRGSAHRCPCSSIRSVTRPWRAKWRRSCRPPIRRAAVSSSRSICRPTRAFAPGFSAGRTFCAGSARRF